MIKTLIIDDEPLAAGIVEEFLRSDSRFKILEICQDGFEGLKTIQKHQPNLIFLDVQMPKITGFEMLELLDEPPAVIFTTAFDEYALADFDTKAIDYLLKPFSKSRFQQALNRFLERYEVEQGGQNSAISSLAEKSQRLVVRVKNEIKIIPVDQVNYL